ncbi:sarcosine oxidase subunit alpha family protein [Amylibacter sp.]|jgi:sarcosine oxidase subunit alpha|nr:sarcosine oxidase subunit alpha family protein [Amylibacter sp.]MDB4045693.1 sarcosine oxidase subunit alpha family protein [Amylibacter sp.]MDB9892189.1 sarcosine oxidase subunit alpha family protein [Amylibacter sp.]MDC1211591.1 sarcosine oxidase subunit alpha family protein [Amylibacter sp.]|tara:strand:- start:4688 stop:7702 length:3015 start_codon:yes stop_codon:yes gene_type:complete
MSTRLSNGGRLINRSKSIEFSFDGKRLNGYEGDTLASALLANNQTLVGRSFKYHRPRGIVACGPEEPNALVGLGKGSKFEPNQRATTTELFEGLHSNSQNAWPSLEFDIGGINRIMSRVFPAGFYYKTFIFPRFAWKHVFEPFIRKAAGLGAAPTEKDSDKYEYFYAHVDVLIIGGGTSGLAAALEVGRSGAKVLVLEQKNTWGGRAPVDGVLIDNQISEEWIDDAMTELQSMPNVTLKNRTMGAGVYDHGWATGYESITDHIPGKKGPRQRLWRIRAKRILTTTGAIERPLSFAGNDLPGVMLAGSVRDYLVDFGTSCGDIMVLATNNDDAYRTAIKQSEVGLKVAAILDARTSVTGELPNKARELGIRVETGMAISKVKGSKSVSGVSICLQAGEGVPLEEIKCDIVAMSGGWSPIVHLWSHCGGKLNWDAENAMFRPDAERPPLGDDGTGFVSVGGTANGYLIANEAMQDAISQGKLVAKQVGYKPVNSKSTIVDVENESPIEQIWQMPQGMSIKLQAKTFLDYQNDVKVSDVRLAAREGYESVEHTKRYTTLGMATDQGKLSNINGLAILADSLNAEIPNVGTTTFRPPYHPISMGSIAGDARGELFKPIRKSPIHNWIEENGGFFEPVADWRRPYCYQKNNETVKDSVQREILNTRTNVGLLDASTLGKIIVKGPDAGKFLDMIYTNLMSNLKVGHCRYGLMCTENGFLSDDGVVARLDENTFLCHTTSGGSDRIHAWMEEWLQTEWWDWKVYTANVTEQYAQIAVVGPNSRKLLEKLGGMDVSKEALPFMRFSEGTIGGIRVRPFRISFSGELSYEIAVPASDGQAFWDMCMEAGKEFGIQPYGTECLHVMRAEKGFIMIGDETDGTVIPQDLNMEWALSKKKEDFLGKRAHLRSHMSDLSRWKLVGLKPVDPNVVIPDGAYATDGTVRENGVKNMIGRVTSTYFSPTLNRSIAMGLVKFGPNRMGEIIDFPTLDGKIIKAEICNQVFLDPEGERQNV